MRHVIFKSRCRGFTIIELIVVMVIAGILAAVIVPRWRGQTGFEERGFRDQLVSALRYAQKSAIAARRTVCASFSLGPASVAFRIATVPPVAADCAVGAALVGPDGNPLEVKATGNASFSSLPADLIFDAAGRPNGASLINVSGLPAAMGILIEAETGYVH